MSRYVTLLGIGGGIGAEVVIRDCTGDPAVAVRTDHGRIGLITGPRRDEVQFSAADARVLGGRLIALADSAEAAAKGATG